MPASGHRIVRDRLKETHRKGREYVQRLVGIERLVVQGGPMNWMVMLLYGRPVGRCLVEHGAMATMQ